MNTYMQTKPTTKIKFNSESNTVIVLGKVTTMTFGFSFFNPNSQYSSQKGISRMEWKHTKS